MNKFLSSLCKIIILSLCLAAAVSCSIAKPVSSISSKETEVVSSEPETVTSNFKSDKLEIRNCSFRIIQTIGKHEGLATDGNLNTVKIIKNDTIIYDDKRLSDRWVLVDTYTYITVKNVVKTVPVFIPYKEYKEKIKAGYHFSIYD